MGRRRFRPGRLLLITRRCGGTGHPRDQKRDEQDGQAKHNIKTSSHGSRSFSHSEGKLRAEIRCRDFRFRHRIASRPLSFQAKRNAAASRGRRS
jgi:hypothetical protein